MFIYRNDNMKEYVQLMFLRSLFCLVINFVIITYAFVHDDVIS